MTTKPLLPNEPITSFQQPGPQNISIEQAMQLAAQHQQSDRLQEAENLLRQILQQQPQHAYALHLLGIIAQQCNQADLAITLIKQAIDINETVALFHSNYGEICRQQKRLDEAITHSKRAIELNPDLAMIHSNLGIAWFDKKEFDKAEACQLKALSLDPKLSSALNNMGSIHRERKEYKHSIDYYQQATVADPNNSEPFNNLGAVLTQDDRAEESFDVLNKALALNANHVDAYSNLGLSLNAVEKYDEAISYFKKALTLRDGFSSTHLGLANAYRGKNELSLAEEQVKKALLLEPESIEALCCAGDTYSFMGHSKEAREYFGKTLQIEPENSQAMMGLGHLEMEEGNMVLAEELFNQALPFTDSPSTVYFHLVQVKKVQELDATVRALLKEYENRTSLSIRKQISINFALGKCFDDLKEPDKAFPYFLEGCRLKRSTLNYDAVQHTRTFDQLIETVDADFIERFKGCGNDSTLPIFVLGVPRSGTTLTEQIIASHPNVFGAGELFDFLDIAGQSTLPNIQFEFPENLKTLTPKMATQWADNYVQRLSERAPDSKYITDKMPANFLMVGLIHALLPNAKIIHVKRNPIDTCLSCFTRLFQRGQEQTYDLAELALYYQNHQKIMAHWSKVLPEHAFLTVEYEQLVADNEHQAKRLIDFCGLDWHDDCLNFHKTKRTIKTASVTQVRQPIYNSSVERWRQYEKYLTPLVKLRN
jgi:tetratricopeptide (TPR) repeat protein